MPLVTIPRLPHPGAPARPRVGFVDGLAAHGSRTALVTDTGPLPYAGLAARVADAASAWGRVGEARRLVLVELVPTVEAVVTYLGALSAGHAVVVAAPGRTAGIEAAYRPDATHDLHPDLALLLSTSGSTGSPRLARLSWEAVEANTTSIVDGLGITSHDVAVTTLPLHYCYGLSVLHTHLAVGATVLLTDASVTDDDLWARMARAGVTTLSGVPHTFELLAAAGRSPGDLRSLRQVTQAGGRLAPERVHALARRGRAEGWELRVMYGQTEATARMSIATADETLHHPDRVGQAVAGGRFEVRVDGEPVGPGVEGDLFYTGPNVMLGYADDPADLGRGRQVHELATGDLARLHADGTVQIVGRRSTFLKVLGLRIDVTRIEEALRAAGHDAVVGGSDEGLEVLVGSTDPAHVVAVAQLAADATGLPPHRIGVRATDAIPRTASGKPDREGARTAYALAGAGDDAGVRANAPASGVLADLVAVYATCLGRPDAGADSTFVALRGDSLSYVEVAVHLEERLGTLPGDWPDRTLRELAALATEPMSEPGESRRSRTSRYLARLDATVVLRGLAITAIVAGHTRFATLLGGAHILLAVAGYNFARFAGALTTIGDRTRAVGASLLRIAVPTALWVTAVGLVSGSYSVANVFLVNWVFGPDRWTSEWRLWFIEALVWILVAVVGLLAVPRVHRWYARAPFVVAAAVATVGLAARLDVFGLTSPPGRGTAPAVLWLFAIGWAAAVSTRVRERAFVTGLLAIGLPGFMGNSVRELTIAAGIVALVWCRSLPVPRVLVPALGVLASSSLYIYLTHFQVYRATSMPAVNLALSLGLGIVTWLLVSRVTAALGRRSTPLSDPAPTEDSRA